MHLNLTSVQTGLRVQRRLYLNLQHYPATLDSLWSLQHLTALGTHKHRRTPEVYQPITPIPGDVDTGFWRRWRIIARLEKQIPGFSSLEMPEDGNYNPASLGKVV